MSDADNVPSAVLRETEDAHRQAVRDMENMRSEMEKMEEERAEMIAEVEAQIESALASMAVGVDVSDEDGQYDGASDAASAKSRGPRSRKGSIAKQPSKRHLRTFPTDTTLAEPVPAVPSLNKLDETASKVETVAEEKGEEPPESPTKKRFSAHAEDGNDGMKAVDEGISERSDRIAQKVLQIQQKVRVELPLVVASIHCFSSSRMLLLLIVSRQNGITSGSSPPILPMTAKASTR